MESFNSVAPLCSSRILSTSLLRALWSSETPVSVFLVPSWSLAVPSSAPFNLLFDESIFLLASINPSFILFKPLFALSIPCDTWPAWSFT